MGYPKKFHNIVPFYPVGSSVLSCYLSNCDTKVQKSIDIYKFLMLISIDIFINYVNTYILNTFLSVWIFAMSFNAKTDFAPWALYSVVTHLFDVQVSRAVLCAYPVNFSADLNGLSRNILSPERFTRKENTPHKAQPSPSVAYKKRP